MGSFIEYLVYTLLSLIIFAMVVNAILSWLIAFDVVNMRNRFVYQMTRFLDAVTRPLLRPVQKVIPPFGGDQPGLPGLGLPPLGTPPDAGGTGQSAPAPPPATDLSKPPAFN